MKGIDNIGRPGYREVLRDNVISWLDYSFMTIGGYIDIHRPTNSQFGLFHKLNKIDNKTFSSRRGNWVWEPEYGINISGVYVNDVLMTSGYSINYRDGIVTFDSNISGSVSLNFSHKYVEVFNAQDNAFFRLDNESFKVNDSYFISGSGTNLPRDRIQLPAIAVEVINRDSRKGYEIGNTRQLVTSSVMLRVLANDDGIAGRIADFITEQKDTTIKLFDPEQESRSGYYPLNYDGTINFASGNYNFLSSNIPYSRIRNSTAFIKDAFTEDLNYITPNLCKVTVRMNLEYISS